MVTSVAISSNDLVVQQDWLYARPFGHVEAVYCWDCSFILFCWHLENFPVNVGARHWYQCVDQLNLDGTGVVSRAENVTGDNATSFRPVLQSNISPTLWAYNYTQEYTRSSWLTVCVVQSCTAFARAKKNAFQNCQLGKSMAINVLFLVGVVNCSIIVRPGLSMLTCKYAPVSNPGYVV